jgi:dienelactone hydrolase
MRNVLFVLPALFLAQIPAEAAVKTETVTYKVGDTMFKSYLAWDDAKPGKRPGVVVFPEWWGLNDYARKRAEQLAGMGYVALAADMYGDGKTTEHPKEAGMLAGAVRKDIKTWEARAAAALKTLSGDPKVDGKKLAAIGYCFGGTTALQLAYTGADVAAVVSFHGALTVPNDDQLKAIKGKILICHGALDTFIPEETAQKTRAALDKGHIDYEMVYYGGAVHSFTNPDADKRGMQGLAYNANADRRSWEAMSDLFREAFAQHAKREGLGR